jgi:hypothetical protein
MTVTSHHTQACFDAWMKCEDLLTDLYEAKNVFSRKITRVVDECALICMGTFHALKSRSQNIQRFALLCIGICEECAEVCEELNEDSFLQCARVCRNCSESISALAFTSEP